MMTKNIKILAGVNKPEILVIMGMLLFMLTTEITLRLFEDRLSGNISHIYSIPSITAQIDNDNHHSFVFLGNSLTNNAINSTTINNLLNHKNENSFSAIKITPDSTAIADWYCIYQNQLRLLSKPPSHIIIGFAWEQLSDQNEINPTRLGGFFCTMDDIQALSATGLNHHTKYLRFLAGTVSHVYVNREAIRNRILSSIIPNYLAVTRQINNISNSQKTNSGKEQKQYSYQLLTELTKSIRASGSDIILMAMPVTQPYAIDHKLIETASMLKIPLFDLRKTDAINNSMFEDAIHLNLQGSLVFSQLIANKISSTLDNPNIYSD